MTEYRGRHNMVADAIAFVRYVLVRFFDDRCPQVASSLSFTTLLAVVPFAAIGLAVTTRVRFMASLREEVQQFVLLNFLPEVGATVSKNLDQLLSSTDDLTTFGIVGLLISAFLSLITIQGAFDQIWRVPISQSSVIRAVVLLLALCLGPELVGLGLLVPNYVLQFADKAGFGAWISPLAQIVIIAPPLLEFVGLGSVYLLLPRCRVRFREAVTGAAVATAMLEFAKLGFTVYVSNLANYQALYGALSVLPVLLLWIYIAWLAVLAGAVVAASMPEWRPASPR